MPLVDRDGVIGPIEQEPRCGGTHLHAAHRQAANVGADDTDRLDPVIGAVDAQVLQAHAWGLRQIDRPRVAAETRSRRHAGLIEGDAEVLGFRVGAEGEHGGRVEVEAGPNHQSGEGGAVAVEALAGPNRAQAVADGIIASGEAHTLSRVQGLLDVGR